MRLVGGSQTLTFETVRGDTDTTEAEQDVFKEQRAIMEAAVSASVDHPNVVSVPHNRACLC